MTINITPLFSLMIHQNMMLPLIAAALGAYLAKVFTGYYQNKNILRAKHGERIE